MNRFVLDDVLVLCVIPALTRSSFYRAVGGELNAAFDLPIAAAAPRAPLMLGAKRLRLFYGDKIMDSRMRKTFYTLCFALAGVVSILLPAHQSLAQEIVPPTSNVNRKFQVKQLQEDFLIFRKVLEEAHPGLYRYTDKTVLDADFDNALKGLNREMTEREFFPIVASIVSAIKDDHTGSLPSSELMSYLKTFPLNLRFMKGKAYIVSSPDNAITTGSELLSINGKKMSGITRTIFAHLEADADIETGKYRLLSQRFKLYYNLFIEQPDSFNVESYDVAKRQKKKISVPPIIENEAKVLARIDDGKKPLRLEFLPESQTALLTIKSFNESVITKVGQDYRQFLYRNTKVTSEGKQIRCSSRSERRARRRNTQDEECWHQSRNLGLAR